MIHHRHNGGIIRPRGDRWQADIARHGRRYRATCATEPDARAWIDARMLELRREVPTSSARDLIDAADARAVLPDGVSLLDAAREYAARHRALPLAGATVAQVYDRYLSDKTAAGLRPRSLQSICTYVGRLSRAVPDRATDAITVADLTDALTAGKYGPATRNTLRRYWLGFFDYARSLGACVDNPAAGITISRTDETTPGILTPDQTAALLGAVRVDLRPAVVIGLFAGLRTAELLALDWQEVTDTHIRITPKTAKKRRQRLIPVSDTLTAWIGHQRPSFGRVAPVQSRRWFTVLNQAAARVGITWPSNAMRHSFASYHLAAYHDASRTALILGHTGDASVFWNHYRELVTEADAVRYFALRPGCDKSVTNNSQKVSKRVAKGNIKTKTETAQTPVNSRDYAVLLAKTPVAQLDRATDS
jgi:integrase